MISRPLTGGFSTLNKHLTYQSVTHSQFLWVSILGTWRAGFTLFSRSPRNLEHKYGSRVRLVRNT